MKTYIFFAALIFAVMPGTAFAYATSGSHEDCIERLDAGSYPEAEACLREDLAHEPENAYTLYLLAEAVTTDARRFAEAEGYYERALRSAKLTDPSLVPEAMLSIGKLSIRLGENERAVDTLSELVHDWPEHYRLAEAYNHLGVALEKLDRFDEALDSFKHAIKLDPDLLAAGYNMKNLQGQLERLNTGRYYMRMGELERAEEHFREAVGSHQNYVAAWFLLGEVCSMRGKPSEAIRCYGRVLALNPNYLGGKEPRYRAAKEYITRGEDGDADEAVELLDGLGYKDSDIIMGELLIGLGRPSEAEAPLMAAANSDDQKAEARAEAHYQLGRVYRAMGNADKAADEFFQALRLMPSVEKYRKPSAD
jgi:tetratricopeptide (TPR) repeat protein